MTAAIATALRESAARAAVRAEIARAAFRIRLESLAASYDSADLARIKFHAAAESYHLAESANRAAVLADERKLQEGR